MGVSILAALRLWSYEPSRFFNRIGRNELVICDEQYCRRTKTGCLRAEYSLVYWGWVTIGALPDVECFITECKPKPNTVTAGPEELRDITCATPFLA